MADHNLNHQAANMPQKHHTLECLHVGLLWVMDVVIIADLYHETVVGAIDGQCFFINQATSETETLERMRISKSGSVAGSKRADRVLEW